MPPADDFRQSLRFRILVMLTLPMLAVATLFAGYFVQNGIAAVEQQLQQQGQDMSRQLAESVAFDLFSGNLPEVKRLLDFERKGRHAIAVGIVRGGRWILASGQVSNLPRTAAVGEQTQQGQNLYFSHPVGMQGNADPYLDSHSSQRAEVVAVFGREPVWQARSRILTAVLGMASLSLLLALLLAWRLSLWLSRPLHDITRSIGCLAAGRPAPPVPQVSRGELGRLESGVNRMAVALEESRHDLEERVRAVTGELRAQKEMAEAAVLAKSRFLAAASHDLRQPLHALTLLVAALRERPLDGDARHLVEHIETSAGALEGLFSALLDLSKLDAGVVVARPECFPAQRTLDNLARQFAPQAREKRLVLRIRPSACWLQSDPVLLERILNNLVSNALRYTDQGGILVGLRAISSGMHFEVHDTGRGIQKSDQERIFEEYFQMDNIERQRDKGLGLGLAIVSRLARLLNSSVAVKSTPGRGSCFSFAVACCQPTPVPAQTTHTDFAMPLRGILVAFVEDDPQILEAMAQLFEQWGVKIAAGSEIEALCQSMLKIGQAPDLILSDYRLGEGRTGIEAVARLREAFGAGIPAALISGDTSPETMRAISHSGLALLHKPLKPAKLRALLTHLCAGG